jgi:hypothetical protein
VPTEPTIPSLDELTVQQPDGDLLDIEPLSMGVEGVGTAALALECGAAPSDRRYPSPREQMTVAESQQTMVPKEDLTPYKGRWVALRDGHVVADAHSAISLRNDDRVGVTDMIMPVPEQAGGTFIL